MAKLGRGKGVSEGEDTGLGKNQEIQFMHDVLTVCQESYRLPGPCNQTSHLRKVEQGIHGWPLKFLSNNKIINVTQSNSNDAQVQHFQKQDYRDNTVEYLEFGMRTMDS